MLCSGCGFDALDGARFCQECGATLSVGCATCGAALPDAAKFCPGCGEAVNATATPVTDAVERNPRDYTPKHLADKILHQKSALEGERKQVTVLFADVKGSMELSRTVDAEQWHQILERFFEILADGVHRFEGTVNQYTGDGIMALFGAPLAHEDHAQRACWSALHLQQALRRYANELRLERDLDFAVRIGINAGEVVVGKIGDDLRMDYTAQGHTVGVAARMQEAAASGSVLLSQAAADLASGFFDLEDLGATHVKGMDEPIHVFELKGEGELQTRFDLSRARGLTRFVGREREVATLEASLEAARRGEGGVVGVMAEAGVGKSRLCFEFAERCRAAGLRVLEGHALAHAQDVPFLTLLQVMRGYYGVTSADSDRDAREKIAGRLLLIDEAFRETLPLIFDFLGVGDPDNPPPPMEPEARERHLFAMLHKLVKAGTSDRVVVTVIEDLHWIDPASEAFIAQWVDAAAGAHNLLLLNFRPEYRAEWMNKPSYQQLAIRPLGLESVREFVADRLGSHKSLDGLPEAIHARTAGNPFFTEEVIRSLIESGRVESSEGRFRLVESVDNLEVPASVQALLASRIDRLAERDKRLLQTAAVIGREVPESILLAVAELPESELRASLDVLKASEFVFESALFPVAEYAFRHPLTQEVALHSQLQQRREQTHAAVAQAIECAAGDKLDEQAALLAHHWQRAGERLTAARWHRRAALWAGATRIEDSLRHWQHVRALLGADETDAEAIALGTEARLRLLNLFWQLGADPELADAVYREGRALTETADNLAALALLEGAWAASAGLGADGDVELLHSRLREAVRLAVESRDLVTEVVNRWRWGYALTGTGRLEESLANIDALLELSGDDWRVGYDIVGFSPTLSAYVYRRMVHTHMGRLDAAREDVRRASEISREMRREASDALEDLVGSGRIHIAEIDGAMATKGDFISTARRGVETAEKFGAVWTRVASLTTLASACVVEQQYGEALEAADAAKALSLERMAGADFAADLSFIVAEARLGLGDIDDSNAAAREGIETATRTGHRITELQCRIALARALLASGNAEGAQEQLEAANATIDATGAEAYRAFLLMERAALARQRGDGSAREQHLLEARERFAAMPAPVRVEQVEALLRDSD